MKRKMKRYLLWSREIIIGSLTMIGSLTFGIGLLFIVTLRILNSYNPENICLLGLQAFIISFFSVLSYYILIIKHSEKIPGKLSLPLQINHLRRIEKKGFTIIIGSITLFFINFGISMLLENYLHWIIIDLIVLVPMIVLFFSMASILSFHVHFYFLAIKRGLSFNEVRRAYLLKGIPPLDKNEIIAEETYRILRETQSVSLKKIRSMINFMNKKECRGAINSYRSGIWHLSNTTFDGRRDAIGDLSRSFDNLFIGIYLRIQKKSRNNNLNINYPKVNANYESASRILYTWSKSSNLPFNLDYIKRTLKGPLNEDEFTNRINKLLDSRSREMISTPEELRSYCITILCRNFFSHFSHELKIFTDDEKFEKFENTVFMILKAHYYLFARYYSFIK